MGEYQTFDKTKFKPFKTSRCFRPLDTEFEKDSFRTIELSQFNKKAMPEGKKLSNLQEIKPVFMKSSKFKNMMPELSRVKSKKEMITQKILKTTK